MIAMRTRLFALYLVCLCVSQPALADTPGSELVTLVETDDSLCVAHGGMLVTLQLTEALTAGVVEVWIDRWFMQVQTADHTRHRLTPAEPAHELGCSHSIAGPQHWTISSIKHLPDGSDTPRKE